MKRPQALKDIFKDTQDKVSERPFNASGVKDGNWAYIHRVDVVILVERAFKAGKACKDSVK